jgi:hypothetical protein
VSTTAERLLEELLRRKQLVGNKEFYVPPESMSLLCSEMLRTTTRPTLSLNRPHSGRPGFVHRLEWEELTVFSASRRPIAVQP